MSEALSLDEKICVITGAGKGLGKAIAEKYYLAGAKLALISRTGSDLDTLLRELDMSSERVMTFAGDVSSLPVISEFIALVMEKFGTVDVLVNNAGMRFRKPFKDTSAEEFQNVMNVNFMSMVYMIQHLIPHFLDKKNGKIINISSIAGINGFSELSAYVSSKAAINGFTRSLAVEYAAHGISVNAVAPGFCKSSYYDNFKKNQDLHQFTLDRTPENRWGECDEIANLCLYLASGMSSYINGEIIRIDGGWCAG